MVGKRYKPTIKICICCKNNFIQDYKATHQNICNNCQTEAKENGFDGIRICSKHKRNVLIFNQKSLCVDCLEDKRGTNCVVCNKILHWLNFSSTCCMKCAFAKGKEKRISTNKQRYNSVSCLGNKTIREEGIKTIRKKYDVGDEIINVGQIDIIKEKINDSKRHFPTYTNKYYTCSKNLNWVLQGFEKQTLELLYTKGFNNIKNKQFIHKFYYNSINDKIKRYFPDFCIDDETYVEAKSLYFWNLDITTNIQKINSVLKLNLKYILVLWDKKGKEYEIFNFDPTKPLIVTENSRTVGAINQTILTDTNQTIVSRN